MCVSRCLRCVSVALVVMAMVCMLSNILLLLPELNIHFLLKGHVTREATWATGLWGAGLTVVIGARSFVRSSKTRGCCAFRRQMLCTVLWSCVCLLVSSGCCLVSLSGLSRGPLCLYDSASGQTWGVPLQPRPDRPSGYLYNVTLWSGVCVRPRRVVLWNLVLFTVMGGASGLQAVLCGVSALNAMLGLLLGPGHAHSKVSPVSV